MGRPLEKSDCDELGAHIHRRNIVCSSNLLEALKTNHGVAEREPDPVVLPPIPNELIAAAHDPAPIISVRDIQNFVCKEFSVSLADMLSQRRTKEIVLPRQIATYLSKKLTPLSLPAIGRRFFRDHTTQLSSIRRVERLMADDPKIAARINRLEEQLGVTFG